MLYLILDFPSWVPGIAVTDPAVMGAGAQSPRVLGSYIPVPESSFLSNKYIETLDG